MIEVKRGDIWLVNFDPTIGYEITKTRPAIIIQNDVGNRYGPLTIVTPVTSEHLDKIYPTDVLLSAKKTGIDNDSKALLSQIRSIDKQRLVSKIGRVDAETLEQINEAIKVSLGLVRI